MILFDLIFIYNSLQDKKISKHEMLETRMNAPLPSFHSGSKEAEAPRSEGIVKGTQRVSGRAET